MRRIRITNPEVTTEKLREVLSGTKAHRTAVRLLGLLKVLEGKENQDTAEFLEVDRHTIGIWVKRVNKMGLAGLEEREGRGRKSQLTKRQKEEIRATLNQSPSVCGYREVLWSGRLLVDHIRKKYGHKYSLSTIYVVIKNLGFTRQRSTRRFVEAQPEKQAEFMRELK